MDDNLPASEGVEENFGATNMVILESHEVESTCADGEENSSLTGEAKDNGLLKHG